MRAYLLGELDDEQASVLEGRYFSDPSCFRWVQDVETELIGEYLQGKLPAPERARFERRYLAVPELTKRLEEVRSHAPETQSLFFRVRWQFALTVFVLVCGGLSWVVWRGRSDRPVEIAQRTQPIGVTTLLAVHLDPGLMKGPDSRQAQFTAPPAGRVRLSLELPGRTSRLDCRVALSIVEADGRRAPVWASQRVESSAAGKSQEVIVEIDSYRLRPGDYVGEVAAPDGSVLETYSFRVNGH